MMITLLLYSPLISFLAVNLLFMLSHYQDKYWHKIYAAIFIFPCLIASSYLLLISYDGSIIISKTIHLSAIPLFITIQGYWLTFSIIIAMNISLLLIIFFTHKNIMQTIPIYSLIFTIISISLLSPDKLIKLSIFSMGSILITLMLLIFNKDYLFIIIDFFLQRLCDFLATFALIMMIIEKNSITTNDPFLSYNEPRPILLLTLFISVFIRVISYAWPHIKINNTYISQIILVAMKTYIGLEVITLLQNYNFNHHYASITYILLITAITLIYFYAKKINSGNINYLYLSSDAVLLISISLIYLNLSHISILLIILHSILLPILSINMNIKIRPKKLISYNKFSLINSAISYIYSSLKLLNKTIYVLYVNILGQFYFGLLFYYFPRVIVWSLNMPLRFFHNGNIETSLIFMIMTIFIYWYIWR